MRRFFIPTVIAFLLVASLAFAGGINNNGSGGGGGSSQWTTSGNNIYYTTGNISVGTNTATYPSTVIGTSSASQFIASGYTAPTSTFNSTLGGNSILGGILAGYGSSYDLSLENRNGVPVIQIPANSTNVNVNQILQVGTSLGIGTATPQSKLHIVNGEVQVGTSGNACAANNAGAISYNGGLNYCNGSSWTAAGAATGKIYNVIAYGADNSGVAASDTAIASAMTACSSSTGGTGIKAGGTVYFPAGTYKLGTSGINWKQGCNIWADDSAYIQASNTMTDLLHGTTGSTNTLSSVWLRGGSWDCNGLATTGFTLPDFARLNVADLAIYNCSLANGGFLHLASASAYQAFEFHLSRFHFYNFGGTLSSTNYGIYADSNTSVPNSIFNTGEIVGTSIGVYGQFPSSYFQQIHTWAYGSQGNMQYGFYFTGQGPTVLQQCEVDPVSLYGYRFGGSNGQYSLNQSNYYNGGIGALNATAGAVTIDTGSLLAAQGDAFIGTSGTTITKDYSGDLTNLQQSGTQESYVTTSVAGAATFSGGSVGIGTTSLANGLFNVVANTSNNLAYFASVGTTNPNANVSIDNQVGGSSVDILLKDAGTNEWGLYKNGNNTFSLYSQASNQTFLNAAQNGNLTLGAAQNVVIGSAGYVGIGTTAPAIASTPLTTYNSATGGIITQSTAALGGGSGGGIAHYTTNIPNAVDQRLGFVVYGVSVGTQAVNAASIESLSSAAWTVGSSTGAYLTFKTTNTGSTGRTEVMRLNGAGSLLLNNASSHAGQATCWTTSGQIGYCTTIVSASGGCTCTGL